jgi:hypothetical protein
LAIATSGIPAVSTKVGELWVTYKVKFEDPLTYDGELDMCEYVRIDFIESAGPSIVLNDVVKSFRKSRYYVDCYMNGYSGCTIRILCDDFMLGCEIVVVSSDYNSSDGFGIFYSKNDNTTQLVNYIPEQILFTIIDAEPFKTCRVLLPVVIPEVVNVASTKLLSNSKTSTIPIFDSVWSSGIPNTRNFIIRINDSNTYYTTILPGIVYGYIFLPIYDTGVLPGVFEGMSLRFYADGVVNITNLAVVVTDGSGIFTNSHIYTASNLFLDTSQYLSTQQYNFSLSNIGFAELKFGRNTIGGGSTYLYAKSL